MIQFFFRGGLAKLYINSFLQQQHNFYILAENSYGGKNIQCQCKYDGNLVAGQWSLTSGSQYASINENGKIAIAEGAIAKDINVQCTYNGQTATKTINVTYDNELVIECAPKIVGTSGNVVSRYNSSVVQPTWSITSGESYATIDNAGQISIMSSGNVTVNAVYNGYSCSKSIAVEYAANTSSETVIDEDGTVTTSQSTTVQNPDGTTT